MDHKVITFKGWRFKSIISILSHFLVLVNLIFIKIDKHAFLSSIFSNHSFSIKIHVCYLCVCVCVKYRLGCNNTNTLTGESTNLYNLSGSDSSKINPKSYKVFLSSHPAILGLLILLRMQLQETIDWNNMIPKFWNKWQKRK